MAAQAVQLLLAPAGLGRPSSSGHCGQMKSTSSLFIMTSSLPVLPASTGRFSMRAVSKKQAYICRDCGYIHNDTTPFDKLPDSYFCPVCSAPKRRFRAYQPAVTKDANVSDVRKARKAQIKRDEAIGNALPFVIVIGVAALAGLYLYLSNTY